MSVPPWIEPARRATSEPPRRVDRSLVAWPLGLLVLLVALGVWRAGGDVQRESTSITSVSTVTSVRTVGAASIELPRTWREVERSGDRATWQSPDSRHSVTLAHAEAAPVPLVAVVRAVARESGTSIAGTRVVDGPTIVDPDARLRRGDAVVLLRLRVERGDESLEVVQAWRRDARAGIDVVATWTSSDGAWPVDPRTTIAEARGS